MDNTSNEDAKMCIREKVGAVGKIWEEKDWTTVRGRKTRDNEESQCTSRLTESYSEDVELVHQQE